MINHVMKKGSATANTLGSIAVIYSAFGVILTWARGTDDDLNTVVAATATGCLYKSTGNINYSSQILKCVQLVLECFG